MKKGSCLICSKGEIVHLLDFGRQPLCNRFLKNPTDTEYLFHLSQGICGRCGVVQLVNPPPADEIRPRFDWITYNEPEGHLDRLVDILCELPGLSPSSLIGGSTFKDDSTLRRFRDRGYLRTVRIDPNADLGISQPLAGIETIQGRLNEETTRRMKTRHGVFDLFIVRHMLEHAHDIRRFAEAFKNLIQPNGYIVFEIPDCERAITKADYNSVWEEHIFYFTRETFRGALESLGFEVVRSENFPYSLENSLVAVVKHTEGRGILALSANLLSTELKRFGDYSRCLPAKRESIQRVISGLQKSGGKTALLGAGHLTCSFINLLGLKNGIEFIVDDDPHKQGLLMPGSHLPIVGSEHLAANGVQLCLMGINPESEQKILKKNQRFLDGGGEFRSIFPDSSCAMAF